MKIETKKSQHFKKNSFPHAAFYWEPMVQMVTAKLPFITLKI